jgi:hypothetical protein
MKKHYVRTDMNKRSIIMLDKLKKYFNQYEFDEKHFITGYNNQTFMTQFKCKKCDAINYAQVKALIKIYINGGIKHCRQCVKGRLTKEEWVNNAIQKFGKVCDYSNITFINKRHKIHNIICKLCGENFSQYPLDHMIGQNGLGIPHGKCSTYYRKCFNISRIMQILNQKDCTNTKITCKLCGKIFNIYDKKTSKCSCRMPSHAARLIYQYLCENNICFADEVRLQNCKNRFGNYLQFDFCIYRNGYEIYLEYDGKQHFTEHNIFREKTSFERQILNDKDKNKYCVKNNLILFRIPYTRKHKLEKYLTGIIKQADNKKLDTHKGKIKVFNKDIYMETFKKNNAKSR